MKIIPNKAIKTAEGWMYPIYRDWDAFHDQYDVKMVYSTTMDPGTTKGPILHKERKYFITATTGTVVLEFFFDGKLQSVTLRDEANPEVFNVVILPENVPIRLLSTGTETGTIINCPSKAWHPDNPDTFKYQSWDEYFQYSSP